MLSCYLLYKLVMSKVNICNTGTTGRSLLITEVVPLYKDRINQIKPCLHDLSTSGCYKICSHSNYTLFPLAADIYIYIKATFSVNKLIPKNAQMITLYTNWYITFYHDLL